ncbi:hypothetical protein N7516_000987 [Penicillium verrucosum]|uniref:uncharacterized protein n=1 Tax=Penicillium verrucosum TaxID=60171 RepID=UPI002545A5EB|nr:uncharacterized protein N7516_000987 [Penicillium verrucosum]KAJ5940819.1 hypothetical protein N7516_000987 [Penicillium verrucosum]
MDLGQLQLMELYLDSSTSTERRRLQNRLAQRRYREKKQEQKQKHANENIWSWDDEPIDLCTTYTESDKRPNQPAGADLKSKLGTLSRVTLPIAQQTIPIITTIAPQRKL